MFIYVYIWFTSVYKRFAVGSISPHQEPENGILFAVGSISPHQDPENGIPGPINSNGARTVYEVELYVGAYATPHVATCVAADCAFAPTAGPLTPTVTSVLPSYVQLEAAGMSTATLTL
eukprot:1057276-Prorocentrum_minimum.AAC.2